jgi:hypothetical protein
VNFADAVFIRLANPASRVGVFDDMALEQIVSAAYDTDVMSVDGPFVPVFDEFRLGPYAQPPGVLDGTWNPLGGVDRTEIHAQILGLGRDPAARVDAIWRGAIAAQVVAGGGRVSEVEVAWPNLSGIDEEIVADLGALPTDPAALEIERRNRLRSRIMAAAAQPDIVTDGVLDAWLARLGASTVTELLAAGNGAAAGGAVQVTIAPQGDSTATSRLLPLTALLLLRDAGFSVAELVAESNAVRERVGALGVERPADAALPRRVPVLIVWVIPPAVFDDPDWPPTTTGSPQEQRTARRSAAGSWLAREGIGLATPELS